jgi:hypothetical protein
VIHYELAKSLRPISLTSFASGEHGVVLTLRRWIDAMLCCQNVRFDIRGRSVSVLVNQGHPQGGVLSPLLWNMVMDGLFRRLHNAQYQA